MPVTGTYGFWDVENIFSYVPARKIVGGKFMSMASLNLANGSLTGDIPAADFGISGGKEGMADTWVQPVNLSWHLSRADAWLGCAFVAPTGKFSPLANNNIGPGYWGTILLQARRFISPRTKALH